LNRFLQFFSSVKCGLILLGLLGISTILGTMILQRPMAQEGQIEQIYAPQTIELLDFFGLFDVFHAWWFILLLGLLGANIALASIERFPQAWRYFSRPHRVADEWYVRKLTAVREFPIGDRTPEEALRAVAQAFEEKGLRPRRDSLEKGTIYLERHRVARLAPYVVHLSLLIIFAGAMVDGVWGYRGFVSLGPGMKASVVEPLSSGGQSHPLPFTLRCDGAGMETYESGAPKQYWTQLAVEESGREVLAKRIHVNEPLTYKGIRFFQSSYGASGVPSRLELEARWTRTERPPVTFTLRPEETAELGNTGVRVELAEFVPDFVLEGNRLSTRSNEPRNPAVQLRLTDPQGMKSIAWFFPNFPQMNFPADAEVRFTLRDLEMGYTTGLQVAKQPGKELIWGGCLILCAGLMLALYMVHVRIWGVIGRDSKGRPVLVLGGQPSKYRESFDERFKQLAEAAEQALRPAEAAQPELQRLTA
jgi:cytochrome c biogenesis protein